MLLKSQREGVQESISLEVESASRTEVAEDRDTLKEGEVRAWPEGRHH